MKYRENLLFLLNAPCKIYHVKAFCSVKDSRKETYYFKIKVKNNEQG